MKRIYKMLRPGRIWMCSGERGEGGKTHLCMNLAWKFLSESPDGYVYSNVIIGQMQEDRTFKLATPERYYFISSLAEFFFYLSENLGKKGRSGKHLLILDEAAAFAGSNSWFTDLSKNLVVLSTLIRKFDVAFIFITVKAELVLKRMREQQEGLLDGRLYKDSWMIEHMKRENPEYETFDQRQLVVRELKGLRDILVVGAAEQIAKRREDCKPNDYLYGTKQPAMLELGVHPVTGEKFDVAKLAMSMSKVWDDDAAPILYDYMHTANASRIPDIDLTAVAPEAPVSKKGDKSGASTKKGVQDTVDKMIREGRKARETMEVTGCSERFFYMRLRILRKQGAI